MPTPRLACTISEAESVPCLSMPDEALPLIWLVGPSWALVFINLLCRQAPCLSMPDEALAVHLIGLIQAGL